MKKTKEQIAEALRHCVNAEDAWACKTCVYYTAEEPEEGPEISCCDRLLLDAAEALEHESGKMDWKEAAEALESMNRENKEAKT